jgi:lipopolysaccharide export system permease protein
MSLIDRYLTVLYLRVVVISFTSLAGVFVVFHAFNNLDELTNYANVTGSFLSACVAYYGPYLLQLFDWTAPILAMMGLLFVLGWLRRTGELTALLAAGIGYQRIARPLLASAVIILVLGLLNREFAMPRWQEVLTLRAQDLGGDIERSLQPCFERGTGILISGKSLRLSEREIVSPAFLLHSDLGEFGRQVAAQRGQWLPAVAGQHPAGYMLSGVHEPARPATLPSAKLGDRIVIYSPSEHPWLKEDQVFVASDVEYDLLRTGGAWKRLASTAELIRRLHHPSIDYGADARVALHYRLLRPFTEFALVLMGLPLVTGRADKNLFVMAGWGLALISAYQLIRLGCLSLGEAGYLIDPIQAAWIPMLVIVPPAVVQWRQTADR